ncbi:hypothetical protein KIH39_15255 [Telmatocola sphagniphila]|uniref:Uncharacterized protein n=1 Tax=Telmatocola sphagniphila TaxID=1123043 RepID=A0A8E6B1E8_9BACT|nr:hypothetical protein [Telmatocola sphagniphila]QVL30210.1 hypothetical protein KIH39_15255 [Telmatocola sphagniphila]
MILGAEVALLIMGLYSLFTGKILTNKRSVHTVSGWPARIGGLICLLPIPLSLLTLYFLGMFPAKRQNPLFKDPNNWEGMVIEGGIVLICAVVARVINRVYRVPKQESDQSHDTSNQDYQPM